MAEESKLCEYCSLIDFELLRHPSVADIDDLNSGGSGLSPFPSTAGCGTFPLGRQSRINESALSCHFCFAVCELLKQNPHIGQKWRWQPNEDIVCLVFSENAGGLNAPENLNWKNKYISMCRLSLLWQSIEDMHSVEDREKLLSPGPVPNSLRNNGKDTLIEAFQSCSPYAPHALIDTIFERGSLQASDIIYGGRRRPQLLDHNLPLRWLRECVASHSDVCGSMYGELVKKDNHSESNPMSVFRLINVKLRNIVEFHNVQLSTLNYACLSYIWGGSQSLTLTNQNLTSLQMGGSLEHLPRTIRDAMAFTMSMDIEYLWVDALCIIQDNDEDKSVQIEKMDKIYSEALFTICAASGIDSDAGLPGVSSPRTATQHEVPLPQKKNRPHQNILTTLSPRQELYLTPSRFTKWDSRGWTLQEHFLSKRSIIFMEHQVFWECSKCCWNEETHLEVPVAPAEWLTTSDVAQHLMAQASKEEHKWHAFGILTRSYQMRNLTFRGDVSDAFLAITNFLGNVNGETFLWGMPVSFFESVLCFHSVDFALSVRYTGLTTRKMTTLNCHVPFPSWSWFGWENLFASIMPMNFDRYTGFNFYYILRNNPLRLEPIRANNPEGSGVVSSLRLDEAVSSIAELSISILLLVPDDQYLFFKAETLSFSDADRVCLDRVERVPDGTTFFTSPSASFLVSELIPYTSKYDDDVPSMFTPIPKRWYRVFIDRVTHEQVGNTGVCGPPALSAASTDSGPSFIRLAFNSSHEAVIMETEKYLGVSYRANIATVKKEAWVASNATSEVIVLG